MDETGAVHWDGEIMGRRTSRPSWGALGGGGALICGVLYAFAWATRQEALTESSQPGWMLTFEDGREERPTLPNATTTPGIVRVENPRRERNPVASRTTTVTLELVDAVTTRPLGGSLLVTTNGATQRLLGPRARLTLEANTEVHVRASAWGHTAATQTRTALERDDTWTLALEPRPGIQGRVLAATPDGGTAVSGLALSLELDEPRMEPSARANSVTDAHGDFFLTTAPGTYRLVARLADERRVRGPRVQIVAGASTYQTWILPFIAETIAIGRPGGGAEHVRDLHVTSDDPSVHLLRTACGDDARASILHRAPQGSPVVLIGRNGHGETFRVERRLRGASGFRGLVEDRLAPASEPTE